MDLTLFYPCAAWTAGDAVELGSGMPFAANWIRFYILYIHRDMYTLKLRGREVGFMLSEIGQDRQALLAINLGGVGASIHKGQSCEEGLALLLALEGQL